jgi:hypothetical protein
MQRKEAYWNGGGLSLRRDVTAVRIHKKKVTMRFWRPFYNKQEGQKPYTSKNLTLGDEAPKVMWAPLG